MRTGGNVWRWWMCLWHRLCWWFHTYMLISRLIKLYTLHMYSFLYVSPTSIKWFKKKKKEREQGLRAQKQCTAVPRGWVIQFSLRSVEPFCYGHISLVFGIFSVLVVTAEVVLWSSDPCCSLFRSAFTMKVLGWCRGRSWTAERMPQW